jgi:16S rRNA (adenine1518-N6/adenine1519-N6)-dimethyltransferase
VNDTEQLFRIIKAAFSQRRKTLLNTLMANGGFDFSKEQLKDLLNESGIGATNRGETLSLEAFAELSDYIDNYKVVSKI